jgi:mRNA interferase RelE/StbE
MPALRPDIPPHVEDFIRHLPPDAKRGIRAGLRLLSKVPTAGAPLHGELDGLWKYRVKRLRIVYAADRTNAVLRILSIGHRRTVYEQLAAFLRQAK